MSDLNALAPLLRTVIGPQTRLVDYQVANQEPDYWVLLARLSQPDLEVVIKLAGPAAQMAAQFDRTAAINRLVAQSTTIPMPEVLGVDATLQKWPWRYLIYTFLPGSEWRDVRGQLTGPELALAQRQIGDAVAQLHQITFPAFGEIGSDGQVAQPTLSCLAALKRHAARIILSPRLQEAFLSALELRSACFEPIQEIGLCHEDLHHGNILFTQRAGHWQLATLLDFDKAWAGPPESDLARLEIWRGMTSLDFWAAYQARRSVDDGYVQRRGIYQWLWCLEFARSTPAHLADTRQVCQELGCPVIENFD